MRKPTETRRREVVASAQEHILKRGLQTLTIKELARANQLSEAALYRHFRSKRDILRAVISDIEVRLSEVLAGAGRREKEPVKRLRSIMRAHLHFTESRRGGLFVLVSESINQKDPVLRRQVTATVERYLKRIRGLLQEAKSAGAVRQELDLEDASLIFFGLIQSAALNYVMSDYRKPPAEIFDTLWGVYHRGIQNNGKNGNRRW